MPGICMPTLTITETRAGSSAEFEAITSGSGSVTVDLVNSGNGLRDYYVTTATNAVVNIPAFTPGTINPVTATFTVPNTSQPVDFTLRAATRRGGVFIRARCVAVAAGPTFSIYAPDMLFWLPNSTAKVNSVFSLGSFQASEIMDMKKEETAQNE